MEQQVVAVEAVDHLLSLPITLVQALALIAVLIGEFQTHVSAGRPHSRDTGSRTTYRFLGCFQVLVAPLIES